jgi:tetratricopeptide (TPR) repeat protein
MNWLYEHDLTVWLMIPIMIYTAILLKRGWAGIVDDQLTAVDRHILKQASMLLILPAVVMIHELGHVAAILLLGGTVRDFHYGILWGSVTPDGSFNSAQYLTIFLAGNAMQVLTGLIFLWIAVMAKAPWVVALCTYSALWSIGETLIFYTIMSIFGFYGDWRIIYSNPERGAVIAIGISHLLTVGVMVYCVYSQRLRLWFAEKTNPSWARKHHFVQAKAERVPTAEHILEVGWSFYTAGLDHQALTCVNDAFAAAPSLPDTHLLEGWVRHAQGKTDQAIGCFKKLAENLEAEPLLRGKAFIAIGLAEDERLLRVPQSKLANTERWGNAVWAYTMAIKVLPDVGDGLFHRAVLLNKAGLYDRAEVDLYSAQERKWLDLALPDLIPRELAIAKQGNVAKE